MGTNKLQIRDNQEGGEHKGFQFMLNGANVDVRTFTLSVGNERLTRCVVEFDCELLTAPGIEPVKLVPRGNA